MKNSVNYKNLVSIINKSSSDSLSAKEIINLIKTAAISDPNVAEMQQNIISLSSLLLDQKNKEIIESLSNQINTQSMKSRSGLDQNLDLSKLFTSLSQIGSKAALGTPDGDWRSRTQNSLLNVIEIANGIAVIGSAIGLGSDESFRTVEALGSYQLFRLPSAEEKPILAKKFAASIAILINFINKIINKINEEGYQIKDPESFKTYGPKDQSESLKKFIEQFGNQEIEREISLTDKSGARKNPLKVMVKLKISDLQNIYTLYNKIIEKLMQDHIRQDETSESSYDLKSYFSGLISANLKEIIEQLKEAEKQAVTTSIQPPTGF